MQPEAEGSSGEPGETPASAGAAKPRSSAVQTAGSAVIASLAGLAIAFLLVLVLATRFLGYDIVRVTSESMEPALGAGDIAIFRGRHMSDITSGQIILFQDSASGAAVIHRVVSTREERLTLLDASGNVAGERREFSFKTQGDANFRPDAGEVDGSEYRGSFWFAIPTLGVVSPSISPAGLAFGLAGVTAVLWAGWWLVGLVLRRARRSATRPDSSTRESGDVTGT